MERPSKKSVAVRPLQETFRKLAGVPYDVQKIILNDLNEEQLMALCGGLEFRPDLKRLGVYCNDAQFWYDRLFSKGYLLPDNFLTIVAALRSKDSEAAFIKKLFFGNDSEQKSILEQAQKAQNQDLALDLDYIWRQILDRKLRKDGLPRVFWIQLDVPKKIIDNADLLEQMQDEIFNVQTISYPELLEYFVEYEMKPMGNLLLSHWLTKTKFNRAQFLEQALAMIGDLLQRGDLVRIEMGGESADPNDTDYFFVELEFYFDGQVLYPVSGSSLGFFLPQQAVPFLIEKKVETINDLSELYRGKGGLFGFESPIDGKPVVLRPKGKETIKIEGHRFYYTPVFK